MDANGQRFWIVSDEQHWKLLGDPTALEYDVNRRSLRLASQRRELTFPDSFEVAGERLERVPQTLDEHGNRAYWDEDTRAVMATGAMEREFQIYSIESSSDSVSDLVMGYDGVLYMAVSGRVVMHDRRDRWDDQILTADGVAAWRLSADPSGGAWALDRDSRKLARVHGMPFPKRPYVPYDPDIFRPCDENPDPPRITLIDQMPHNELPVAVACSLTGNVAVLSWSEPGLAHVRFLEEGGEFSAPLLLRGVSHPHSIAWVADDRLACLIAGSNEAPTYRFREGADSQWPAGDLYPLKKDYDGGPFVHTLAYPPHYATASGSRALARLSFPFYAKHGMAVNEFLRAPMDSGSPHTVWHRLYVEAVIPKGCGIKIFVSAGNDPAVPDRSDLHDGDEVWYEHRFGAIFGNSLRAKVPTGAWVSQASEVPHHPGFLPCPIQRDRAGLFTVLIQRSGKRVRTLSGRFLHFHVEFLGNGRATPEIFAIRAYGSRFSYIQRYLPRLYRESTFNPEADQNGAPTAPDFLERFVSNVEGMLTSIEDRVGHSYLLTLPGTTSDDALEWLGSWLGIEFDDALPLEARRELLEIAAELHRWNGTLRGLELALEVASGHGLTGGEIVLLEDFKLRRVIATILGADFSDEEDPLTAGGMSSGNSYVGDTLFLGDESKKEFLALFSADLPTDTSEQIAIEALFDKLAYRVTVLVHQEVSPQDLGLIRRIAEKQAPAHVQVRVFPASEPFLVGMASLVGVDSYLAHRRPARPVRVGQSRVGRRDFVQGPAALDPRIEGIGSGVPRESTSRPVAVAPDETARYGQSITLDGSQSRAFGGRKLVSYIWKANSGG